MAHSKVTGYFLSLLKASLDTRQPIPSEKLTADEWAQIFEMSKKQNMTALLSAGIERLDLEALPHGTFCCNGWLPTSVYASVTLS